MLSGTAKGLLLGNDPGEDCREAKPCGAPVVCDCDLLLGCDSRKPHDLPSLTCPTGLNYGIGATPLPSFDETCDDCAAWGCFEVSGVDMRRDYSYSDVRTVEDAGTWAIIGNVFDNKQLLDCGRIKTWVDPEPPRKPCGPSRPDPVAYRAEDCHVSLGRVGCITQLSNGVEVPLGQYLYDAPDRHVPNDKALGRSDTASVVKLPAARRYSATPTIMAEGGRAIVEIEGDPVIKVFDGKGEAVLGQAHIKITQPGPVTLLLGSGRKTTVHVYV